MNKLSKADIGRIYKEKQTSNGVIYFTEMMSSMFLVLAENSSHQTVFSQIFPFTATTKTKQRKLAKDTFNRVLYKSYKNADLDED